MEYPSYSMSDRYADLLKTMWFIFLYSGLIPICVVFFIIGLFCFYWIDKVLYLYYSKYFFNYFLV